MDHWLELLRLDQDNTVNTHFQKSLDLQTLWLWCKCKHYLCTDHIWADISRTDMAQCQFFSALQEWPSILSSWLFSTRETKEDSKHSAKFYATNWSFDKMRIGKSWMKRHATTSDQDLQSTRPPYGNSGFICVSKLEIHNYR